MSDAETTTTTTTAQPVTNGADRTIPYSRFAAVNAEKKAFEATLTTLRAELDAAKATAATAASLAAEVAAAREELGLVRSGLADPEAVMVVRALYAGLPTEGRPASLVDYVASLKAEGATVPKSLAPWLAPPAVVVEPPATTTTTKAPMPTPPAASGTNPPAQNAYSAATIRELRLEAVRTGDWSKVTAAMPHMDAAVGKKRS